MKPFDLERCIAGEPVITQEGEPYKFGAYNPDAINYQLIGWIDGEHVGHTAKGFYVCGQEKSHPRNLFMAPTERTEWVVRIVGDNGRPCIYGLYSSEEAAKNDVKVLDGRKTYHPITITE